MSPTRAHVGLPAHLGGTTPPPLAIWSDEFNGPTLNATMWAKEERTFNVGTGQYLDAVWNANPNNIVISAATAGGHGNSLKLNVIRENNISTGISCPATLSFSTGGIRSRGNTSGAEAGPYRIQQGNLSEVRLRYSNVDQGHRPCIWTTSYNRADAEIDWVEFFGSNGSGALAPAACVGTGVAADARKLNHYSLFWSYGSEAGTKRLQTLEDWSSTAWMIYQFDWRDRAIKIYRDGQLQVHWGDAPLDPAARFAGASAGIPYKWASAWNGGGTPGNRNNYVYPQPFDAGNISRMKLTDQVGGVWCQPLAPSWLSAPVGTIVATMEVDYVAVFNNQTTSPTSFGVDAAGIDVDARIDVDGSTTPVAGTSVDAGIDVDAAIDVDGQ